MAEQKGPRRTPIPELRVVFDTNVLYTESASDLLKQEAAKLIEEKGQLPDLKLTWYLPHVVVHERLYQMQKAAFELLPALRKLERIIGHNLNITEEIINTRVREAAERQRTTLGIEELPLATGKVDWERLITDALYRQPPFDPGKLEKGFRDALIAEAFLQLVEESPTTPKICRVALVTGDQLLTSAVRARTEASNNVRILGTLEELEGLISTLTSEASEEFVENIKTRIGDYFFEKGRDSSLYYKEDIRKRISETFADQLKEIPEKAERRENSSIWLINHPRFVRKEGQRVYWASRINVESKAYTTRPTWASLLTSALTRLAASVPSTQAVSPTAAPGPAAEQSVEAKEQQETVIATGTTSFEVLWSVVVTTKLNFTKPEIEKITHVGTSWKVSP